MPGPLGNYTTSEERVKIAFVMVALLVAFIVWRSRSSASDSDVSVPSTDEPSSVVGLGVNELPSSAPGQRLFELVYDRGAGVTQLRFSYVPKPVGADAPASFTRASLYRQPPSQAEPLLEALARAHAARRTPRPVEPLEHLDCEAALFGERLSMEKGQNVIAGAFTNDPAGSWIVLKLFIPPSSGRAAFEEDEQEPAELFLALDPVSHQAVFLAKDPEYWPALERELSRVL